MMTKPAQNFLLCPRCRSNLSVLTVDGREKIVIEIYKAPTQPALPGSIDRQGVMGEVQSIVRSSGMQRRLNGLHRATHRRSSQLLAETLKQYRLHKWDKHLAAHALGIRAETLVERIGHYRRRGWIKRNGTGWVRTKLPAHNFD